MAPSSSRFNPGVRKIERQMPFAAPLAAPWVSSDRWAEASKPVIVYCVSRKPSGSTYHQNIPCPKPELLIVSVNTKSTLWWVSGTKASTSTCADTASNARHSDGGNFLYGDGHVKWSKVTLGAGGVPAVARPGGGAATALEHHVGAGDPAGALDDAGVEHA